MEDDRAWTSLKRNWNFQRFGFRLDTNETALEGSLSIIKLLYNYLQKHRIASMINSTHLSPPIMGGFDVTNHKPAKGQVGGLGSARFTFTHCHPWIIQHAWSVTCSYPKHTLDVTVKLRAGTGRTQNYLINEPLIAIALQQLPRSCTWAHKLTATMQCLHQIYLMR